MTCDLLTALAKQWTRKVQLFSVVTTICFSYRFSHRVVAQCRYGAFAVCVAVCTVLCLACPEPAGDAPPYADSQTAPVQDFTPDSTDAAVQCKGKKPCCCNADMFNYDVECISGKWRCPDGFYEACDPFPNSLCYSHYTAQCDQSVIGKACSPLESLPCSSPGNFCSLSPSHHTSICTCACTPDIPKTKLINEDTCPRQDLFVCAPISADGGTKFGCVPRQ